MRVLYLLPFVAACGMSGADKSSGGNVGFGGQQDIGEFRSILERGEIPGAEVLDANGFFNEHFAPPPSAPCDGVLCVTPGMSVGRDWLTGAHQATLQITVHTPLDPKTFTRKPLNLVVIVDRSGSMAQDGRLEKVKGGLHTLIDQLQSVDRLSLVEFDSTVEIVAPFGAELDRPRLHQLVSAITPGGATNIFDALKQGFMLSNSSFDREHQNRVIFLSDGMATAGNTNTTDIIAMADSNIEEGIGLTTIGVGDSFDVALMRGLAEHGAGNFYFLEDAAAATEVFTQELDYFSTPIALGVQIEATAGAGFNFGEVVGTKLWTATSRSGTMRIPAVFLASRTTQGEPTGRRGGGSMLFIHLDPNGHNVDGTVATLKLTYRLPETGETITQNVTLQYPHDPSETPPDVYLSAPEMAERFAMYNMFLGFRLATKTFDLDCALATLNATRSSAVSWNATHEDPDLAADIELLDLYVKNLRNHGASGESTTGVCRGLDNPYGDDVYYDEHYGPGVCAAGTKPSAFGLVALAGLVALRRRRRR